MENSSLELQTRMLNSMVSEEKFIYENVQDQRAQADLTSSVMSPKGVPD